MPKIVHKYYCNVQNYITKYYCLKNSNLGVLFYFNIMCFRNLETTFSVTPITPAAISTVMLVVYQVQVRVFLLFSCLKQCNKADRHDHCTLNSERQIMNIY